MFLGSFSFINATQFVNLLQSIASNAAGYAFKIALATMCPTCDEAMTSLQKVIQQMNSMAGDSCRIAQTAVNFMADQAGANELSKSMEQGPLGSIALAVGAQADAFSAYLDKLGRDSNTKSLTSDEVKEYLGNIAWKVLQKNGYITTAFLSGDADMAEALMSFTGTIIGYKAGGDDPTPTIKEYPSLLTAKDLLRGGSSGSGAKKYNCSDHVDCLGITTGDYTFKGLETYVAQTLLGAALDAGSDSFIYKLITNSGALTMDEKRLIRVSPYHTTRLRNMAICTYNSGVGSLAQYSQKAALADRFGDLAKVPPGSRNVDLCGFPDRDEHRRLQYPVWPDPQVHRQPQGAAKTIAGRVPGPGCEPGLHVGTDLPGRDDQLQLEASVYYATRRLIRWKSGASGISTILFPS